MIDLSALTFPVPPHPLGVLVHAWAAGDPTVHAVLAQKCFRPSMLPPVVYCDHESLHLEVTRSVLCAKILQN